MSIAGFYIQILDALNKCDVEYLLVGGHAVNFHGYVRATLDLDIWVNNSEQNLEKLLASFIFLGYNKENSKKAIKYFKLNHMIKLPKDKAIIDILDDFMINEVFVNSFKNKETMFIGNTEVKVVGFEDLLKIKYKSNRTKDLLDVQELKTLQELRQKQVKKHNQQTNNNNEGFIM